MVSEDSRCLSEKSELVSPKRQMSNVLESCGLWTERSSQTAGVFTRIKEETLYSEITDSCASSLCHIIVQMSNCQVTRETHRSSRMCV